MAAAVSSPLGRRRHLYAAVTERLLPAEQTGAAVADAADGGQVGVMEDRQLHGQTPLHTERYQKLLTAQGT